MFKKSNRNFRTKKAEFDSDEEDKSKTSNNEPKEVPNTVKVKLERFESLQTNNENSSDSGHKTSKASHQKILSFGDENLEEENGFTEFKVKKSKESRRISKELKKSRKEKERQLKAEFIFDSKLNDLKKPKEEPLTSEDLLFNEGIKVKPLNLNIQHSKKKFIANKYKSQMNELEEEEDFAEFKKNVQISESETDSTSEDDEASKLQKLRREMETLNGEETEPIEEEEDETKRSMKLILKSGIIPDATMIHAARKKREMARQGDFIPVEETGTKNNANKSRIVREEDENELSDEEAGDQSRVSLNFRESAHNERQKVRDNFLAFEQGSEEEMSDENQEDDDEEDRWEKEQIRKGVQITQAFQSKIELEGLKTKGKAGRKIIEQILGSNIDLEPMDIEPKMYDVERLSALAQISFLSIKNAINKNISLLEETNTAHKQEHRNTLDRLNAGITDFERINEQKPSHDKLYVFYQDTKSFLTDFADCYNEKLEDIEKAESEWLDLFKQRAEAIIERRQEDIRDMSTECSTGTIKKLIDQAHQKRMILREQR